MLFTARIELQEFQSRNRHQVDLDKPVESKGTRARAGLNLGVMLWSIYCLLSDTVLRNWMQEASSIMAAG